MRTRIATFLSPAARAMHGGAGSSLSDAGTLLHRRKCYIEVEMLYFRPAYIANTKSRYNENILKHRFLLPHTTTTLSQLLNKTGRVRVRGKRTETRSDSGRKIPGRSLDANRSGYTAAGHTRQGHSPHQSLRIDILAVCGAVRLSEGRAVNRNKVVVRLSSPGISLRPGLPEKKADNAP